MKNRDLLLDGWAVQLGFRFGLGVLSGGRELLELQKQQARNISVAWTEHMSKIV